jgi:hypothetical protein
MGEHALIILRLSLLLQPHPHKLLFHPFQVNIYDGGSVSGADLQLYMGEPHRSFLVLVKG